MTSDQLVDKLKDNRAQGEGVIMFCSKCQNDLSECVCDDIDEKLASIGNDYFIYKKCNKCGKHYTRCKCEKPEWMAIVLPVNQRIK